MGIKLNKRQINLIKENEGKPYTVRQNSIGIYIINYDESHEKKIPGYSDYFKGLLKVSKELDKAYNKLTAHSIGDFIDDSHESEIRQGEWGLVEQTLEIYYKEITELHNKMNNTIDKLYDTIAHGFSVNSDDIEVEIGGDDLIIKVDSAHSDIQYKIDALEDLLNFLKDLVNGQQWANLREHFNKKED